jgi:hypothetical protein
LEPSGRPRLIRWLQGLPAEVRVVLTTRPNIIEQYGSVPRSTRYEVCDFSTQQIHAFVDKWFQHTPDLGFALRKEIDTHDSLRKLAAIPLLLTCLAIDAEIRQNASFPDRLLEGELLRRIVEIILERWDATRTGRPVDHRLVDLGTKVFSEITLTQVYGTEFTYHHLTELVRASATAMDVPQALALEFVDRVIDAGWLLVGSRDHGLSFGHAAFFDYFFAQGIRASLGPAATLDSAQDGQ